MDNSKIDWKKLRAGEKVKCPECEKGVITTNSDPKISHFFKCTHCNLKINID